MPQASLFLYQTLVLYMQKTQYNLYSTCLFSTHCFIFMSSQLKIPFDGLTKEVPIETYDNFLFKFGKSFEHQLEVEYWLLTYYT